MQRVGKTRKAFEMLALATCFFTLTIPSEAMSGITIQRDVLLHQGKGGYLYAIVRASNGAFVIAGNSVPGRAWASGIDQLGNVQWEYSDTAIPDSAPHVWQNSFNGAIALGDGSVMLCGFSSTGKSSARNALLVHLDQSGHLLERKLLVPKGAASETSFAEFVGCLPWNGGYAIYGNFTPTGGGQNQSWLLRLDGTGAIEWEKLGGADGPASGWKDALATASGTLALVTSHDPSFGSQIVLLDTKGNVVGKRTFPVFGSMSFLRTTTPTKEIALTVFDESRRTTFFYLDQELHDISPSIVRNTIFVYRGIRMSPSSLMPAVLFGTTAKNPAMPIAAIEQFDVAGASTGVLAFEPTLVGRHADVTSLYIRDAVPGDEPGQFVAIRVSEGLDRSNTGFHVMWLTVPQKN
jgi:hypothetical protein